MRTKSEISIEESDSSMLNEKRRLNIVNLRSGDEASAYT